MLIKAQYSFSPNKLSQTVFKKKILLIKINSPVAYLAPDRGGCWLVE
jgi:hypothetical protein